MKRSAEHLQVIVITGASDGIGAELAVQLAARHRASLALVLAARNEERLQMVARTCKRYGSVCLIVPTNVASESECKHLIRATVQQFGGIDILINNAGRTAQSSFTERRDLGWHQELMRVNYWGSVWCTHAALPYLRESRGKILTIGTHASLTGLAGASAYSASKAALSAFYQCLRDELRGSACRSPDGVSAPCCDAFAGTRLPEYRHTGRCFTRITDDAGQRMCCTHFAWYG
jgi:short-subunit dehydrogenase